MAWYGVKWYDLYEAEVGKQYYASEIKILYYIYLIIIKCVYEFLSVRGNSSNNHLNYSGAEYIKSRCCIKYLIVKCKMEFNIAKNEKQ